MRKISLLLCPIILLIKRKTVKHKKQKILVFSNLYQFSKKWPILAIFGIIEKPQPKGLCLYHIKIRLYHRVSVSKRMIIFHKNTKNFKSLKLR